MFWVLWAKSKDVHTFPEAAWALLRVTGAAMSWLQVGVHAIVLWWWFRKGSVRGRRLRICLVRSNQGFLSTIKMESWAVHFLREWRTHCCLLAGQELLVVDLEVGSALTPLWTLALHPILRLPLLSVFELPCLWSTSCSSCIAALSGWASQRSQPVTGEQGGHWTAALQHSLEVAKKRAALLENWWTPWMARQFLHPQFCKPHEMEHLMASPFFMKITEKTFLAGSVYIMTR